jgi:hypothetical protein
MNSIDSKIRTLHVHHGKFVFIEYYAHTSCLAYKIINPWSEYKEDKLVLCSMNHGIEKALDLAIKYLNARKSAYIDKILSKNKGE